jgi:hypothetical protein
MPDFLYAIALLRDSVWGGIAVVVAVLIPVLAQLLRSASRAIMIYMEDAL